MRLHRMLCLLDPRLLKRLELLQFAQVPPKSRLSPIPRRKRPLLTLTRGEVPVAVHAEDSFRPKVRLGIFVSFSHGT
jgi:hypothetical protein